jgi:hypothetical protein
MRALRLLAFAIAASFVVAPALRADTEVEVAPQSPAPTSADGKIAVVVMPDALAKAQHLAGQDNWIAINIVAGSPSGVRLEAFPFTSGNFKVAIEGFVGEQRLSFAGGGGLRLQFRVVGNARNALYVSPGVDLYVSPPSSQYFGHYKTLYFVASDVDVSWVHEFSDHFAYELGLKVGGSVEFNAPAYESLSGTAFVPDLAIFTGVRF